MNLSTNASVARIWHRFEKPGLGSGKPSSGKPFFPSLGTPEIQMQFLTSRITGETHPKDSGSQNGGCEKQGSAILEPGTGLFFQVWLDGLAVGICSFPFAFY